MMGVVSNALNSITPRQQRDLAVVCGTLIGVIALQEFRRSCNRGWLESTLDMGRNLLNRVPGIVARQEAEVESNYATFCAEWDEKYAKFGDPLLQIPEEGWSEDRLCQLIHTYAQLTNEGLVGKHFSGTVYLDALNESQEGGSQQLSDPVEEASLPVTDRTKLLPKLFQ